MSKRSPMPAFRLKMMKEKEAKKPVEGRKRGRPAKAASPKVAKAETAEAAESAQTGFGKASGCSG